MAARHARNAIALPDLWPGDFAAAKAIEAVAYGGSKQRRKAGQAFREAFLFKPQRQDVVLAGTNLLLKFFLNNRNFLPFDKKLLRRMHVKAIEDRASSYVDCKINKNHLRRDFRFVALDWYRLVIDGKASRLKEDKSELTRMLNRLQQLNKDTKAEILPAYQSTEGQLLAYLGEPSSRELLEAAVIAEPQNSLYLMRFANALLAEKDHQGALNILKLASKLDLQNPFYAHSLGMALVDAGKQDRAVEALAQAAASESATAKMQADLAIVAMRAGQHDLAETAMRKAVQKIPIFGKYQNRLNRILANV